MTSYSKEIIRDMVEGRLDWPTIKDMMSSPKDDDRFWKYIEVLQERVSWNERILLPIGEHLFVVAKGSKRIVKCECGHEFGDYRVNWKLYARIFVRDTEEALDDIHPGTRRPDAEWCEVREFICPGCAALLEVESVAKGYPVVMHFLPDLDRFYQEWLQRPLEREETCEDKTCDETKRWGEKGEYR